MSKKTVAIVVAVLAVVALFFGVTHSGSSSNGWTPEAKSSFKDLASIAVGDADAGCYTDYLTSHMSYDKFVSEFAKSMADDSYTNADTDALAQKAADHCGIDTSDN